VPRPRQVFAIGLNYAEHVAEANMTGSTVPQTFTKFPTCLTGPYTKVKLPPGNVDWEVELVAVIGHNAHHVSIANAWDHVAGFTVGQPQRVIGWVQAHFDTVDHAALGACRRHHRRGLVGERLAVGGCRGVQVDEVADPVDGPVGGTGDHHAPIAVANQDRVAQVLEVQQVDDVGDVAVQVDTAAKQVLPLAQTVREGA
jgi:hypothetical protein